MKKVFIIAAMVFAVCNTTMAQKRNVENEVASTAVDYSFKVNHHSICRYLALDEDQTDKMAYIIDRFDNDLHRVGISKDDKRYDRLMKAISYNISAAHKVLDEKQYRKYLSILNVTLRSKNIDKVVAEYDLAMNE